MDFQFSFESPDWNYNYYWNPVDKFKESCKHPNSLGDLAMTNRLKLKRLQTLFRWYPKRLVEVTKIKDVQSNREPYMKY